MTFGPRDILGAVLGAYAQVVFSHREAVGAVLLVATLVRPTVGLWGLACALLATGLGLVIGLDRERLRRGSWGFNALLIGLALGASWLPTPSLVALQLVAVVWVLVLQLALSAALTYHLRLPALSLPFVLGTWTMSAAAVHTRGLVAGPILPGSWVDQALPDALAAMLRAIGELFAIPDALTGALVLVAIAIQSRVALVCALVGWAIAAGADRCLFTFPPGVLEVSLGFNPVLAAVALGAVFHVPGRAALAVSAVTALLAAVVGVASTTALAPLGLPVGAWPFNLTVLVGLYALAQRSVLGGLVLADPNLTPEENLRRYRTSVVRFGSGLALRLPFLGRWLCTQGHDGAFTHQGDWRHGLDFEASNAEGETWSDEGTQLVDHYCWQLPITAPVAGTVVVAVDGQADQPIGEQDTNKPWGNCVVLHVGPDQYLMFAHFAQGSVRVAVGEVVRVGQELGRCGSSGRAPSPHLHVQAQATPEIGAYTQPIAFADVVWDADDHPRLLDRAVPELGQRFRNLVVDAEVAAALSFPVGGRWRYLVDGRKVELRSELDLLGRRVLCDSEGGRLIFDPTGWSWLVLSCDARPGGLVHALSVALPKVPYDGADGLVWQDVPPVPHAAETPIAWLWDAVAWLAPHQPLRLVFTQERRGAGLVVRGKAPSVRTEVALDAERGLVRVVAELGGRALIAEREVA